MLLEVVDQIDNIIPQTEESFALNEWCETDEETQGSKNEENFELTEDEILQEFPDETCEDDLYSNCQNSDATSVISVQALDDVNQEFCDADCPETDTVEPTIDDELVPSTTVSKETKKSHRKSNPESWIRNKRKLAKNTGQSYVASNGRLTEAKKIKKNCGQCRMNCSKKISEENRLKNFTNFYQLADIVKQRKFLFDHMKTYEPKRHTLPKNPNKVRTVQRHYFLDTYENGSNEMLQVCRLMFLNTFSISSQMIDTLYRKATFEGKFNDIRGKFERKQSKANEFCVQHLAKYPYTKSDARISLRRLYEMYLEECLENDIEPLKESTFYEIRKRQSLSKNSSDLNYQALRNEKDVSISENSES